MAETSFPILEEPLSDVQWKSVARGFGTGVLDEGGNPYRLTGLNNVNNTGVIATDSKTRFNHAVVSGFYHKMDSPITVSLPAVSHKTTYWIVLMYDPVNKAMPVRLSVVTSLDATGGKEYLVLWKVTRQPNQLLTDSTRVKQRPIISPTIVVDSRESLPAPSTVLWGTRAFIQQTNVEVRASYTSWVTISPHRVELSQPSGWEIRSPTAGVQVVPAEGGFFCTAGINPIRRAFGYTMPGNFHSIGEVIPAGYRPSSEIYTLVNQGNAVHEAYLATNGHLHIRSRTGNFALKTGDSMGMTFSWFTPRTY
ncbi:hypothetical protein [Rothia sp. CCM 9416]|uniref:hypothetical protein n=1 Tax=Rothia sp. CCM 9416 TaxID=3402655 RepID=UPI003AEB0F85